MRRHARSRSSAEPHVQLLSPEMRVRKDHPLRANRAMVDEVLIRLSRRFDSMYARAGRPSIGYAISQRKRKRIEEMLRLVEDRRAHAQAAASRSRESGLDLQRGRRLQLGAHAKSGCRRSRRCRFAPKCVQTPSLTSTSTSGAASGLTPARWPNFPPALTSVLSSSLPGLFTVVGSYGGQGYGCRKKPAGRQ